MLSFQKGTISIHAKPVAGFRLFLLQTLNCSLKVIQKIQRKTENNSGLKADLSTSHPPAPPTPPLRHSFTIVDRRSCRRVGQRVAGCLCDRYQQGAHQLTMQSQVPCTASHLVPSSEVVRKNMRLSIKGVPQNGWFMAKNSIEMDDKMGSPHCNETLT